MHFLTKEEMRNMDNPFPDEDWDEVLRASEKTSLAFLKDEPDLYKERDWEAESRQRWNEAHHKKLCVPLWTEGRCPHLDITGIPIGTNVALFEGAASAETMFFILETGLEHTMFPDPDSDPVLRVYDLPVGSVMLRVRGKSKGRMMYPFETELWLDSTPASVTICVLEDCFYLGPEERDDSDQEED